MEDKLRFSIIIPTYNRKTLLEKCLGALSAQLKDHRECEVIVVDDSGAKLQQAGDSLLNVRYLTLDHRGGPSAARNLGISNSKGEIILFLDDDTLPLPGWFAATEKAWQAWPDSDGIGGYIASDEKGNIYSKVEADLFNWLSRESMYGGRCVYICTCNAGYKKTSLGMIGGFDESFKYICGEDRDINIRLFNKNGILRVDKNIAVYHDQNAKFSSFIGRYFRYGQAARFLHLKYSSQVRLPSSSYVNLLSSIPVKYKNKLEMCAVFLLVIFSQALIAFGYFTSLFIRNPFGELSARKIK